MTGYVTESWPTCWPDFKIHWVGGSDKPPLGRTGDRWTDENGAEWLHDGDGWNTEQA